jgi:hypothetical protein
VRRGEIGWEGYGLVPHGIDPSTIPPVVEVRIPYDEK